MHTLPDATEPRRTHRDDPPMQTLARTAERRRTDRDEPTLGQMLEQILDLNAGLAVVLLPLYATALPGILLLFVLPAVLLLAAAAVPAVIVAALVAPPYLLVRFVRRRLSGAR